MSKDANKGGRYEITYWSICPTWGGHLVLTGRCPKRRKELQPEREDKFEKPITTSRIVKIEGLEVTTYSGSVYTLRDVDPHWHGPKGFDPAAPSLESFRS